MRLLVVTGPRWARAVADLAAALTVVSLVAVAFVDGVAVAVFALVLLGLVVARLVAAPAPLQAATGAVLLLVAWAAVLSGYERVPWLDVVAHVGATGVLAAVAVVGITRARLLQVPAGPRGGVGLIVVTVAVGIALAVLWELGEWYGHTYVDDGVGVGYEDTIGDLAAGGLGAVLAGLVLARGAVRERHRAVRGPR
ncbi:hypothetical protein FE374_18435 [Georgenia yuyongxinii]|uniref:DUF2238 domain-containing protein n=1 Tax=Georgenia yuyongxinii TaxID=2589797 RepID=A0A5B8C7U1_9MICO|nr:hypothetical protein FE374_18435 [Georgenia yuyongxinii]